MSRVVYLVYGNENGRHRIGQVQEHLKRVNTEWTVLRKFTNFNDIEKIQIYLTIPNWDKISLNIV